MGHDLALNHVSVSINVPFQLKLASFSDYLISQSQAGAGKSYNKSPEIPARSQ